VNRRGFLRMLGTGAAVGGVAAVAPSQVWPFRKIFLPQFWMPKPWFEVSREELTATMATFRDGLSRVAYPGSVNEALIEALQLEQFAKEIPDLMDIHKWERFAAIPGVEVHFEPTNPNNPSAVKCAEAATKVLNMRNGNRILFNDTDLDLSQWQAAWHGPDLVRGDMSLENLNRSEIIAGSLKEKPAYKLRRAARKLVDSLKVSNEDLGWDG
jgi:hypothetical protein